MIPENYFRYIKLTEIEQEERERTDELLSLSNITHLKWDCPNSEGSLQQAIGFLRMHDGDVLQAYKTKQDYHLEWRKRISNYVDAHKHRLHTKEAYLVHQSAPEEDIPGFDELFDEAKQQAQNHLDTKMLERVFAYLDSINL